MSFKRNPEGWDTGGGRREAKRSLKAVIVVGQPFPRPRAHLHGNVGLRLPPCLLGPTDRKQSAPGAAGKRLVSGVSASAEDSEAAVVPEPEVCASWGEGCERRWLGGCKLLDKSQRRSLAGTFLGFSQRRGGQAAVSVPCSCGTGKGRRKARSGFQHPRRVLHPLCPSRPPTSPPPSAGFVLFRGPGISRRVLGFFSGGGGRGRASRGACRDL